MKKVMAFGVFDGLHPGHLAYLKQARELGDELIVVVSRDSVSERIKGKKPVIAEEDRVELIGSLSTVDEAILGLEIRSEREYINIVSEHKPEVIALGYDQDVDEQLLKTSLAKAGLKTIIKRVKGYRPQEYKSSKLFT